MVLSWGRVILGTSQVIEYLPTRTWNTPRFAHQHKLEPPKAMYQQSEFPVLLDGSSLFCALLISSILENQLIMSVN